MSRSWTFSLSVHPRFCAWAVWCLALLAGYGLKAASPPATIYVDPMIPAPACADYDPASRVCGTGTNAAYRTLRSATAAALPGTTVLIRSGTYNEPLVPALSGTPGLPIIYQGFPAETAFITGPQLDPAIDLSGRSYIVLDGLTVSNVVGWLHVEDASNDIVRNCTFARATATGSRAGLKFIRAHFNQIFHNRIEDGNDNLSLIDSNLNVVEGNTIRQARHALWNILCGNYNVLRHNSFRNEIQKIGQITDCEGSPSGAPLKYDATKFNLVEQNSFEFTPSSGNSSPYAGIQYSAQKGIIRRNSFYNTVGPGIQMTLYSDEARHNTATRIFHNVFVGSSFAGVELAGPSTHEFSGHVFKNNIFFHSRFVANDRRWPWYTLQLDGKPVQIITGRFDGFIFEGNDLLGTEPGQAEAVTYGRRDSASNPPAHPLTWWQQAHPEAFTNNLEVAPQFLDENAHDFRLVRGSPLIDAGAFLTRTTAGGAGAAMAVEDAGYFCDGFGIPGESGDTIQLAGETERARILRIDYDANLLMLDRALTWTNGQGVALPFNGTAPDVGAVEFGPVQPRLSIWRQPNAVLVSWPAPAPEFFLQTTSSLLDAQWTRGELPALVGDQNTVTNSPVGLARFYRLAN